MLNTKPQSKPRGLQVKIMRHLADHPAQTIVKIQTGVGSNYHSAISRAVKGLAAEGAVTPLEQAKLERGPPVNLWGLSLHGFLEVIYYWGIKTEDVKRYCHAYKDIYPFAEGFFRFINAFEAVSPEKDFTAKYIHTMLLLKKYNYNPDTIKSMMDGYMIAELGFEKVREFFKVFDGEEYDEELDNLLLEVLGIDVKS